MIEIFKFNILVYNNAIVIILFTDASTAFVAYRAVPILYRPCRRQYVRVSIADPPNIHYWTCVLGQTMLYLQPLSHAHNRPLHDLDVTLAEQE